MPETFRSLPSNSINISLEDSSKPQGVNVIVSRSPKHNVEDPNIQFVRNEIESKLGLNVQIVNKKNNSGKVIIEYKTLDQFDLISKKLRK